MVKDRLTAYLKHKKMGMREFSRLCDIGISVLSRISDATAPKTLRKIDEKSDLNTDWLMYGEGEMIKPKKAVVAATANEDVNQTNGDNSPLIQLKDLEITLKEEVQPHKEEQPTKSGKQSSENTDNDLNKEIERLKELLLEADLEIANLRGKVEEQDKIIDKLLARK